MPAQLPTKITAPLPASTPQIAQSLSQPALEEHRARISFEVRMTLAAYFDPSESDEVKAGLLAWFCDELEDWTHEQVVWALRGWNRENPRRRPTPGDIVAMLKKARGEKVARQMAEQRRAEQPAPVVTEEARKRNAERVNELFPMLRRVPEVRE